MKPDLHVDWLNVLNEHRLCYDVRRGLQVLFTVALMNVYEHEKHLDAGRFKDYTEHPHEWDATIKFPKGTYYRDGYVEQRISWIAQHNDQPWNMRMEMDDVFSGRMIFSFADSTVGTMFKLVFG